MRRGGLVNLKTRRSKNGRVIKLKEDLDKRELHTLEKTGRYTFFVSKELSELLKYYLKSRLRQYQGIKSKALFLGYKNSGYTKGSLNNMLKKALKRLHIKKRISPHTFRKTLNNFRKDMGCPNEDRRILIGHKTIDTNVDHYTNKSVNLFDRWNPYKNLKL
jgi:integrase